MFCSARQVRNRVRNTELIYFKTTMAILCLQLFFFSIQSKLSVHACILIKLSCLIPFSKYQSHISISLAALEVKCA